MSAADVIAARRAANRADVTLPSGLRVSLKLPDLQECLAAGEIPMPLLRLMREAAKEMNGDPAPNRNGKRKAADKELSSADLKHMIRYQREMIRASVIALEGEPLDNPLTDEDIADVFVDPEDRAEVIAYAGRDKAFPTRP